MVSVYLHASEDAIDGCAFFSSTFAVIIRSFFAVSTVRPLNVSNTYCGAFLVGGAAS